MPVIAFLNKVKAWLTEFYHKSASYQERSGLDLSREEKRQLQNAVLFGAFVLMVLFLALSPPSSPDIPGEPDRQQTSSGDAVSDSGSSSDSNDSTPPEDDKPAVFSQYPELEPFFQATPYECWGQRADVTFGNAIASSDFDYSAIEKQFKKVAGQLAPGNYVEQADLVRHAMKQYESYIRLRSIDYDLIEKRLHLDQAAVRTLQRKALQSCPHDFTSQEAYIAKQLQAYQNMGGGISQEDENE